ncbi:NADP-dependent malic enzyme [Candidatus Falkowbacteria bacterium]|nr:NADP-dependent malic enzyme [Candidatus Falkowbacteria bacterium]
MPNTINQAAAALHRKYRGKLTIKSKVPLTNRRDLALAYTPGVGEISRQIARSRAKAYDYTFKANSVAVVSNGTAVLGLGNIGPEAALPVMEGKALLFKQFGDVDAIPLCINATTVEGVVEFVKQIAPTFGGINLEDIAAPECFTILERLQAELTIPVIHDDQQGTAVVVLAAMMNALRVVHKKKETVRVVINGAGAAGLSTAKLFLQYGFKQLILCDSQGPIYQGRKGLNESKLRIAALTNLACRIGLDHPACAAADLASALCGADIFVGVSKAGLLNASLIKLMRPDPIIFAMANPVPEVMPEVARRAGVRVMATGRSDFPNQINNVLVFPGIFRGALDHRVKNITDAMLLRCAKNLAALVSRPTAESIIPSVFDRRVMPAVARAIR